MAELLDQHGNPVRSKYLRSKVREKWKPCSPDKLRMVILSLTNSGKTTFACSKPRTLVLDLAGHANMVPHIHKTSHVERVTTLEQLFDIVQYLSEARRERPWETVVVDDVDIYMDWMLRWLSVHPKYNVGLRKGNELDELWSITDYGDGGKGWYIVRDEMMDRLTNQLSLADYGWIVLGNFVRKHDREGNAYTKSVLAGSILDAYKRETHYVLNFVHDVKNEKVAIGEKKTPLNNGKVRTDKVYKERPVHRVWAEPQQPDDEEAEVKARFIEYIPKRFIVDRKAPWDSWVKVYTEAVRKTAEELEVELDDEFATPKTKKAGKTHEQ